MVTKLLALIRVGNYRWTQLPTAFSIKGRYGHTADIWETNEFQHLLIFGGIVGKEATNNLWAYDFGNLSAMTHFCSDKKIHKIKNQRREINSSIIRTFFNYPSRFVVYIRWVPKTRTKRCNLETYLR